MSMDLSDQGSAEYLLEDDLEGEKSQTPFRIRQKKQSGSSLLVKVLVGAIIFLLGTNLLFFLQYKELLLTDHALGKSKYGKLWHETLETVHTS